MNTFKLINAEGKENLCKFHVLPKEGRTGCPSFASPPFAVTEFQLSPPLRVRDRLLARRGEAFTPSQRPTLLFRSGR